MSNNNNNPAKANHLIFDEKDERENWFYWERLIEPAFSDKDIIKRIQKHDIHIMDNNKTYLLHEIVKNRPSLIKTVLDMGVDINKIAKNGETALLLTTYNLKTTDQEKIEYTNLLIQRGANIHQVDMNGNNLLFFLNKLNHVDLQPFLDLGLNINQKFKDYRNYESSVLLKSCNVDSETFSDIKDITPPHFKKIQRLINYGADVNTQDSLGRTCLHAAITHYFPQLFRLILNNHPDLTLKDNNGHNVKDFLNHNMEDVKLHPKRYAAHVLSTIKQNQQEILNILNDYEQNKILHQEYNQANHNDNHKKHHKIKVF